MKLTLIYSLIAFCFLWSCNVNPTQTEESSPKVPESVFPALLQQALDAHGTLNTWDSFNGLALEIANGEEEDARSTKQVINLKTRNEHIVSDAYVMGYDGTNFWFQGDTTGGKYPNPKFYINLQFYFFAMPFVMADPGINYEVLDARELEGKPYDVLKITYNDGVGQASKDQYLLYLDQQTHRLELLLYSVTYFDEARAESYNALRYLEWQETQGLWVPKKAISYKWDESTQQLGEQRSVKIYRNIEFQTEGRSKESFSPPVDAIMW